MNYLELFSNNKEYFDDFIKRYTYKTIDSTNNTINNNSREMNELNNNKKALSFLLNKAYKYEKINKDFVIKLNQIINENIITVNGYREFCVHIVDSNKVLPEPEQIDNCMDKFFKFYNSLFDKNISLLDVALVHLKYEAIHPFLDGNGRLGRFLLIYLLLIKNKCPFIIPFSDRPKYLEIMESRDKVMLAAFLALYQRIEEDIIKTFI